MPSYFKSQTKTRKQIKAQRARLEAKVKRSVRAACVERDRGCRLAACGRCEGALEWCHLGEWKRAFTRGMAPVDRHQTRGSFMACARHHRLYDSGEIGIAYGPDGANGPLTVWRKAA